MSRVLAAELWTAPASPLDSDPPVWHAEGMTNAERTEIEAEVLDLRGLKCPLPVLHTRRRLMRLPPRAVLVVRCTDPLAGLDIPNLVREMGDVLVEASQETHETRFTVRRA